MSPRDLILCTFIAGGVLIVAGQAARGAFWRQRTALLADDAVLIFGSVSAYSRAVRVASALEIASLVLAGLGVGAFAGATLALLAYAAGGPNI